MTRPRRRLPTPEPGFPTPALGATASGLVLALAFPSADWSFLAWVGLVPLFHAISERLPSEAFRLGWLSGFVFHLATLYWIAYTIATFTPVPLPLAVVPLACASAALALYWGAFAAGVMFAGRRGFVPVLFAALWWAGLEWVRSWLLLGFPWGDLGYTQHAHRSLMQVAELTGVYGLSALIVACNAAAFAVLSATGEARRRAVQLSGASLALVVALQFGGWRLDTLQRRTPQRILRAAIVQGNVAQGRKWDESYQEETIAIYERLTREAASASPTLVVWPETAMPFYFQLDSAASRRVREIARGAHAWLLFGSPAFEREEGDETSLRNRAYLLSPHGATAGVYDKVELVPFGEYVPLSRHLFFVDKLVEGAGTFEPGPTPRPLALESHRIGVLICYEAIFPALGRRLVASGADVLVNVTNDAWFGPTSAPHQHLAMAALRAVENRVPLLRAANTGISAIVMPDGSIHDRIDLDERGVRTADLAWPQVRTFYSRFGDVFAVLALGVAVLLLLVPPARRLLAGRAAGRS